MDMNDSGTNETFTTGCIRDSSDDKARPELISPFAAMRLAGWLTKGASKYEDRNWEKGMPISRCVASLERHLIAFKLGMVDEDHVAAIMCNIMFIAHYEEAIKLGILPKHIDDMPKYVQHVDGE